MGWYLLNSSICDGIGHGLKLTSQILEFSKYQPIHLQIANVNSLLEQFEAFLRYAAGAKLGLTMDLSSDVPKCRVDPTQFQAAILNLVSNARDATPNGGEVFIRTNTYTRP